MSVYFRAFVGTTIYVVMAVVLWYLFDWEYLRSLVLFVLYECLVLRKSLEEAARPYDRYSTDMDYDYD